jgi:O-antigen ligase
MAYTREIPKRIRVRQPSRSQPATADPQTTAPDSGRLLGRFFQTSELLVGSFIFFVVFPALVLWGGSTDIINWGPGILTAGTACLLLFNNKPYESPLGRIHSYAFLLLIGLLYLRARYSPDPSATANNVALMALVVAGFLIGRLAGVAKCRAWSIGLAAISALNLFCTIMQVGNGEWNLIYPDRSGGMPSGLFAHYSYSSAFCLGAVGLLVCRSILEVGWLRAVLVSGAACALITIPLSPSRGGNLALALLVAAAGALLLARAFWRSKSFISIWVPAVMLLLLVMVFASAFVPLINRGSGPEGFYVDGVRVKYWTAATQIAASHPWLGGGAGSFAWEVFHVLDGLSTEPGLTHNEALQLAVDYGYPSLFVLMALITAPLLLALWRFVSRADTATAWAALGLLAMLFQSNFENIFHSAPGAFIAAIILGQMNRGLWAMPDLSALNENRSGSKVSATDVRFLSEIKALADEFSSGGRDALASLVRLLSQSKEARWWRAVCRLTYWQKVQDEDALHKAVLNLGSQAAEELAAHANAASQTDYKHLSTNNLRSRLWIGKLALTGCALCIVLAGAKLSRALWNAWEPLYHPDRLTISSRFGQLLDLAEKHPGLGIDREILATGLKCIHRFKSQAAKEYWATAYQKRLMRAIPGWRTDPGAALQLAEITGWAGDYLEALELYDLAISRQGKNEALFMSRAFKGQYLYELSLSAGAAGQTARQHHFAGLAVECFEESSEAMGKHRRLDTSFVRMLRESQALLNKGW